METAEKETVAMAVDVVSDIVINKARDEVAAYAGDPTNAPRWYVNIKSVEWQTPPPIRIGSRVSFVAHFLGRRMAYTYEITELVPATKLVMRTSQGPFPMETTYTWEDTPNGGTRMTLRNRGNPTGFSTVLGPLTGIAIKRANTKDLRALKAHLEHDGRPAHR